MKVRARVLVAVPVVVFALLVAWSGAFAQSEIVLRFQQQDVHNGEWLNRVIAEFEAEHPGVRVEVINPAGNYIDAATVALVAGTAADVIHGWGDIQYGWAEQGFLLDLNPLIEQYYPDAPSSFFPAQWDSLVLHRGPNAGLRYGIPMYINVMGGLGYNVDAFDETGVAYPDDAWTWDDLESAARKLVRENAGVKERWGFATTAVNHVGFLDAWMRSAGGGILSPDYSTFTGDSPESVEALSFLHRLIWEQEVAPGKDAALARFIDGQFPMFQVYSVWVLNIQNEAAFNWNVALNPRGPAGIPSAMVISDSYSINAGTKYPELAFRFIMKLTSEEANRARAAAPHYLMPSHRDAVDAYLELMPEKNLEVFVRSLEHAKPDPRVYVKNPTQVNDLIRQQIVKVLGENELPPQLAMEQLKAQLEGIWGR